VVWCIAAIAKKEDVFVVCKVTDRARYTRLLLLLRILVRPCLNVEFDHLLLIFHRTGCQLFSPDFVVDMH
jgi:hypothetical protein